MKTRLLKHLFPALCAVTFSLLIIATPGYSASQDDTGWTRVVTTRTIVNTLVNGCYGDEHVDPTGQLTSVTATKVGPDGATSVKEDFTISMTGTGRTSGANYTFNDHSITHIDNAGMRWSHFSGHQSCLALAPFLIC